MYFRIWSDFYMDQSKKCHTDTACQRHSTFSKPKCKIWLPLRHFTYSFSNPSKTLREINVENIVNQNLRYVLNFLRMIKSSLTWSIPQRIENDHFKAPFYMMKSKSSILTTSFYKKTTGTFLFIHCAKASDAPVSPNRGLKFLCRH